MLGFCDFIRRPPTYFSCRLSVSPPSPTIGDNRPRSLCRNGFGLTHRLTHPDKACHTGSAQARPLQTLAKFSLKRRHGFTQCHLLTRRPAWLFGYLSRIDMVVGRFVTP